MGNELYSSDPDFRESINESRKIISKLGVGDILPNYDKSADKIFFGGRKDWYIVTATQLAIYDSLLKKNIAPDAVMGISMGEIASAYSAGALSKTEVFTVLKSTRAIKSGLGKEYIIIYVSIGLQKFDAIRRKSPVEIYPIYELSNDTSLALLHSGDLSKVRSFFNDTQISWKKINNKKFWPYHTELVSNYREKIYSSIKSVEPKPLEIDLFSSVYGKKFPKGTILTQEYWYKLLLLPVHCYQIMGEIKSEFSGIDFVQIGPEFFGGDALLNNLPRRTIKLFPTIVEGSSELQTFKKTERRIRKRGKRNYIKLNQTNSLEKALQNFPYKSQEFIQNPMIYYNYLMERGSVHYIPPLNGFMILHYDDVSYALKNPGKFSSRPYSSLEKNLVGADPPDHTRIRSLLQPLFTRKIFKELEEGARNISNSLIQDFPKNKALNFVDAFSIPLAKRTISKFFGFSPEEESELETRLIGHLYADHYYDNLFDFLYDILNTHTLNNSRGAIKHTLSLVDDGYFSISEAASLLRLLWLAGITTTSSLISYSVFRLIENKHLCQLFKKNPQLMSRYIQECVRLEAPESYVNRITTEDVSIGNCVIPKNSLVFLNVMAANRDQKYFDKPNEIHLNRKSNQHLAFGGGVHHCIGMPIANLEAKEAIKSILEIYSSLHLNSEKKVTYFPSTHFRALEKLEVILTTD